MEECDYPLSSSHVLDDLDAMIARNEFPKLLDVQR